MASYNMSSFSSSFFIHHYVCETHPYSASRHGLFQFCEYATIYLFFHSIVDGRLARFPIRAIRNSVAMNILELVFW